MVGQKKNMMKDGASQSIPKIPPFLLDQISQVHIDGLKDYPTISHMKLGGGFKYFLFSPYLGKIPILTNIFQMGWNHQLGRVKL